MKPVTRDLDDPSFPHGTEKGYFRGCKRECCLNGKRKAANARQLAKIQGQPVWVDIEPVRAHLQSFIDMPEGYTVGDLSRATGVSRKTVGQVLYAQRGQRRIGRKTAAPLLAVTHEQVAASSWRVPTKRPAQQVRSMMALGWPGDWIKVRLGYSESTRGGAPNFVDEGWRFVRKEFAEQVDALAREIGDTPGPSPITARRMRAAGHYPPAAYNDEGDLDLRRYPGHPWAEADDMVGRLLDALTWWSEHPAATLTEAFHSTDGLLREQNEAKRLRDRLKRQHGDRWHEVLGEVVRAYAGGADGTLEALRAGLVVVGSIASTQVPKDHPAVAEMASGEGVSQAS